MPDRRPTEFDSALVEKAAYAVDRAERRKNATYEDVARAVLSAVADDLRAEGAAAAANADADEVCKCGHNAWVDHGGVMAPPAGCDECACPLNEEQAAAGTEGCACSEWREAGHFWATRSGHHPKCRSTGGGESSVVVSKTCSSCGESIGDDGQCPWGDECLPYLSDAERARRTPA